MRIQVFQNDDEQWYFRLVADNGETVAQSEGYLDKQDALDTIDLITDEASDASVEVPAP